MSGRKPMRASKGRWRAGVGSWLLAVLFFFFSATAYAVDPRGRFDLTRWRNPSDWPFIPLPEIGTDPNGETTVGFLPVWLFTDDKNQIRRMFAPDLTYNPTLGVGGLVRLFSYPSDNTQWYIVAGGAEKIDRNIDFLYSTGRTRQDWWSFDGRVRYARDPTERFFGVGNGADEESETNFTTEELFAEARLGINVSPRFQLALELRPRYVNIQQGAFDSIPFTGERFPRLKGLRSNHELRTRVILSYDTRDSVSVPRRGSWVTLFGGIADRSLLSSVSYSLFGIEGRHYYPLGQRLTLAGHLAARYMPVGARAPFWAPSRLAVVC